MPIQLSWQIPRRVVLAYGWGLVTPDDLTEMGSAYAQIVIEGSRPVHTIMDLTEVRSVPSDGKKIAGFIFEPDKTGWLVIVAGHTLSRALASLLYTMLKNEHVTVSSSMNNATQFIRRHDPTLSQNPQLQ